MGDYWPFMVACWLIALGIYGYVTKNKNFALTFVAILFFSWALTALRLFVLERA
jgi:hypothetical protein